MAKLYDVWLSYKYVSGDVFFRDTVYIGHVDDIPPMLITMMSA